MDFNRKDFREWTWGNFRNDVLRVAGLANFCARVSGISSKTSYFSGFQSHMLHESEKPAFEGLKQCKECAKTNFR